MGGHSYDYEGRNIRSQNLGYKTKSFKDLSTQTKEKRVHDSMLPYNAKIRECRDSEIHPNSIPIIVALDVTGSMGHIPQYMIAEGLPHLMKKLSDAGYPDAAVMFLAIGDHECDNGPLQVAQFESGDEQLDMWLTRTWLEEGGGGNGGESYLLAWYYALKHVVTDAWEKRSQKGILITIGDEPNLRSLPASAIRELMGKDVEAVNMTAKELYDKVSEKWDVRHIHVKHKSDCEEVMESWKRNIGENVISVDNQEDIVDAIVNRVKVSHNIIVGSSELSIHSNGISIDSSDDGLSQASPPRNPTNML